MHKHCSLLYSFEVSTTFFCFVLFLILKRDYSFLRIQELCFKNSCAVWSFCFGFVCLVFLHFSSCLEQGMLLLDKELYSFIISSVFQALCDVPVQATAVLFWAIPPSFFPLQYRLGAQQPDAWQSSWGFTSLLPGPQPPHPHPCLS